MQPKFMPSFGKILMNRMDLGIRRELFPVFIKNLNPLIRSRVTKEKSVEKMLKTN